MKVVLADLAGFCMGVKRAMDIVSDLPMNNNEMTYTYGPVIHNPQVISTLVRRNILIADENTDLRGKKVVIRSHGISPQRREQLQQRGAILIDATCPKVSRIQEIINKCASEGYGIIIYGDSSHSEVKGLMGFGGSQAHAIDNPLDLKRLPRYKKVCLVSQSTKDTESYYKFAALVKSSYKEVIVHNTLCNSTTKRQEEALRLAEKVDALVVVGGYTSSNTCVLAKVSADGGKPVLHIETEAELDPDFFKDMTTVGLTAGASTPAWLINRVHERLKSIRGKNESRFKFYISQLIRFLINSNIQVSIGAGFLSYAASTLMGIQTVFYQHLIAPLYIFSINILSNFVDFNSLELNQPSRINFFLKNKWILVISAIVSAFGAAVLAGLLKFEALFVVLIAMILGLAYSLPILPEPWKRRFHLHRLRDIPASRDIMIALAWAFMTSLIHPIGMIGYKISDPHTLVAFLWTFGLVFIRSIVYDIRYLQGDALMGHSTIPVLLGMRITQKLLSIVTIILIILLSISSTFKWTTSFGFLLLLPVAYSVLYQNLALKKKIKNDISYHSILDFELLLCGLLAITWKILFS